jgi:hypothetical protein
VNEPQASIPRWAIVLGVVGVVAMLALMVVISFLWISRRFMGAGE